MRSIATECGSPGKPIPTLKVQCWRRIPGSSKLESPAASHAGGCLSKRVLCPGESALTRPSALRTPGSTATWFS